MAGGLLLFGSVCNAQKLPPDSTQRRIVAEFKKGPNVRSGECELDRAFLVGGDLYLEVKVSAMNCLYSYLLLYRDGRIQRCAQLGSNCDDELSFASYTYTDAEQVSDTVYKLTKVTEKVKDKNLIDKDGWIKGGKSREDVPTRTDSTMFRVTPSFLLSDRVAAWPKVWKF